MTSLRKATLAACIVSANAAAILLDQQDLAAYKVGISEMVKAGKDLEHAETNQALATYRKEQTRLATFKEPNFGFDSTTANNIDVLVEYTKNSNEYKSAHNALITSMTETTYSEEKAKLLTKAAAVKLKDLLIPMGVRYTDTCGNNVVGHKAFLEANATITPATAETLIPGSYCLYHFMGETHRLVGTKTPCKTVEKSTEGKE